MSNPNLTEYLAASEDAYSGVAVPGLTSLLDADGNPFVSDPREDGDGFYGAAYIDTSGNVIIAFRGTGGGDAAYNAGSAAADAEIFAQTDPQAFTDAENFFVAVQNRVQQIAKQNGTTPAPIFVTGHSLGGAEAEDVAVKNGFLVGGAAIAAPGLPDYTNSTPPTNFVSYVAYGDPVANYASDVDGESGFAPLSGMDHVGTVVPVGNASDGDDLAAASLAFENNLPSTFFDPLPTALKLTLWPSGIPYVGIGLLGNIDNHFLINYANDLGLTVPGLTTNSSYISLIDILSGLDAPLGAAGDQDFQQATFSDNFTLQSPNFTIELSADGSAVTIDQNQVIQGSSDFFSSDPGELKFDVIQSSPEMQSATFVDSRTGAQETLTFSTFDGVEEKDDTNYENGTSSSMRFSYTSDSGYFYSANYYSSSDEAGRLIGNSTTYDDGMSQTTAYNADGSSAAEIFSEADGNGTITQEAVNNADGSSLVVTYDASGTPSESYTGAGITTLPPGEFPPVFSANITSVSTGGEVSQTVGNLTQQGNTWTLDLGNVYLDTTTSVAITAGGKYSELGGNIVYWPLINGNMEVYSLDEDGMGFSDLYLFNLGYTSLTSLAVEDFNAGQHTAVVTYQSEDQTVPLPEQILTITEDVVVACFFAGARLATPCGEVAVEELRSGDLVLTVEGDAMPVRWVGVQSMATRFGDPLRVLPIRIRAGALTPSTPSRDLLLSPGHAVLIDGLLVQAGALVNAGSIARCADIPETFRYYHVELPTHAVILAEGTPVESYLDALEATAFDNIADRPGVPDGATELPYPRIKAHRQMPAALRAQLAARSAMLAGATNACAA